MKRTQDEWHLVCWAHRGQSGFYIYGRRDHLYPVLASAREAGIGDIFPLKGSSITSNHQSVTIGNNCLPLLRWQFYTPQKNVPAFIRKAFRRKSNIKRICIARLCATLIGSVGYLVVLKMFRIIFDGNTRDVKSAGFLWPISKRLRRGVRSDAQLSSTETRFQKCSHCIFWMPSSESSHPGGSEYV